MQITDENPELKAAQLSRLHRIESRAAAEFSRALALRGPHHPHAIALAGTTLMLIDATLRTWYRDGLRLPGWSITVTAYRALPIFPS